MKPSILLLLVAVTFTHPAFAQWSDSPDRFDTENGELTIHAVNHGSVVFTFDGKTIIADPYGGADLFSRFGAPDIILITDIHGDHHDPGTLDGLDTENTTFVVPRAVAEQMDNMPDQLVILANGESAEVQGIPVSAIPMYNFPGDETVRHPRGRGNGYLVNFGEKRLYLSGDTEDIPEMRNLEEIDIAFLCMNLPYTMDIHQASSAVIEFQPAVVYPYHHRGQDIEEFKALVDAAGVDVDVRLKDWYPE
ncbi:MAG: MBL fold metallo-hydrolase [Balneolaceae bacterium]